MKIIFKDLLKGILIGMLFLPLEFAVLSLEVRPVQAQDLRDLIRSQVDDLRDRPCDEDPRQSCSRPIPTHRPEPTPEPTSTTQPSGQPTPTPTPIPGVTPTPGTTPTPTPTPAIGGNDDCHDCGECEDCEETKEVTETKEVIETRIIEEVRRPWVLGLSYTGSGKW